MVSSPLYSGLHYLQDNLIQCLLLKVAGIQVRTQSKVAKSCALVSTTHVPSALGTQDVVFGHELSRTSLMERSVKGRLPYT